MGEGDPGRQYQGGVRACGNALARSFALTRPRDFTAPERQSTDYPVSGSPARCARSALSRCSRNSRSVVSTRSTRISWSTAARSMGCRFSMAASPVRQASRVALGVLGSDAPIAFAELAPNAADAGALGEARRQNRHQAIVVITRGARPGFCPSNADSFLRPFGPPVLQVASRGSVFPCRLRAGRCESRADSARRTHGGASIQCRRVGLRVEQRRGATGRDDAAKRMVELRKRARRRSGLLAGDDARRARRQAGQGRSVRCFKRSRARAPRARCLHRTATGLRAASKGLDSSRRQHRRSAGARQYPAGLRRRDGIDDGRGDDRGWAADRPAPSARRGATRRSPKHSPRRRAVHFDHRKERSLSQSGRSRTGRGRPGCDRTLCDGVRGWSRRR